MTALRPVLASLLLAVLTAGGVALPAAHQAVHALETAAESAEHGETVHGDEGDHVQTPCAPAPHDIGCAVCAGVSAAADLADATAPPAPALPRAASAFADWVESLAAAGAGARAPPVS